MKTKEEWIDAIASANANGWHQAELARQLGVSPPAVASACKRYGLTIKWTGQKGRSIEQQQPSRQPDLADKLCRLERMIIRARLEVDALRKRVAVLEAAND